MSDFKPFAAAVHAKFNEMSQGEMFVANIAPDLLYEQYLAAFPDGSNPIFRERTEHDCSCCKNFIRNIGNVVSIVDGQLVSVWDVTGLEHPYNEVAEYMSAAVKETMTDGKVIESIFRSTEPTYGAETSKELKEGIVRTWNHFHAKVSSTHYKGEQAASRIGEYNGMVQVFRRGLDELTADAFTTVIDLIDAKALYRGEEHLAALKAFQALQTRYSARSSAERELFIWANAGDPFSRFRNTAIGTLIQDLSEGMPLEKAVKAFETKVAPTNYKRPTALITPKMVELAMATITDLGLEPALERRMARLSDVSVNNVLWVDNSVKSQMKGGIAGLLMAATKPATVDTGKAEAITIDDFMANVLPQATSIDLLTKNAQQGNFVSITAPVHADAAKLFKWDNGFAWSYAGEVTDAIKERVKAAGGTVEGDLCCRLAWEYRDDLDFHMKEPGGGHIHFGNRRQLSRNGGMLDLDANGADGQRDDPSENIFYTNRRKMAEGVYTLLVNNYNRRSDGAGFVVQIEFDGQVFNIVYDKVLRDSETVEVAQIRYKDGAFAVIKSLPSSQSQRDIWGIKTEAFTKINTIMHSPNFWDDQTQGNKHVFFLLEGCKNPDAARGVYNEFLRSDLEQHRKVFEVLGNKTKCQPTDDQLSGLGFSSTRGDKVTVNVAGANTRRTYEITF